MSTVVFHSVSFAYDGHKRALDSVSFDIDANESVAIVGANGAGKSTLLQHTAGLLFAQEGTIEINGVPSSKQNVAHVRSNIGFVFQDPNDMLFMPTVFEDVAFGPANLGLTGNELKLRVEKALQQTHTTELAERPPHHLSGGQKRLVSLAAVLAMEPKILAFDEPTAHLDPRARRNLINIFRSLQQTRITTTHDLDFALDVCERTIVLSEGRVVFDGSTANAFSNAQRLESWGLELPLRMQKKD